MGLTKLTTDLDNIQALSDKPNEIEGLTADELKAKFDKAGDDIKTYINDTLTAETDTALGLKVNTADIVNTLVSTSTTLPLSANMGADLKTLVDTKLGQWVDITIGGDSMEGGTITTQVGGANVSLSNYKLLHIIFRAIGNSAHRQNLVMVFPTANNYLLTQYNNVVHHIIMNAITNGSFGLLITPATGSNLIQLVGIRGIL